MMINIKILGTGCPNCIRLEKTCNEIVEENQLDVNIEKVTDMNKFADYGVMMTPGLVINGKVMSQGKIPVKSTLETWLKSAAQ